LENEVRELTQRLANIHKLPEQDGKFVLDEQEKDRILSSSRALEADVRCQAEALLSDAREECRDVLAHLAHELQTEVQALSDPKCVLAMMQKLEEEVPREPDSSTSPVQQDDIAQLRKDVGASVESLRNDLQSNTEALRAELSAMVSSPVKALRKKLEDKTGQEIAFSKKVDAQQADLARLRQELSGDMEDLRGDMQRLKRNAARGPTGASFSDSPDFARSLPVSSQGRPPLLERDLSRGRLRPRSATRRLENSHSHGSSGALSVCSDLDVTSSECFHGLVGAVGAMARVIGLLKDGNEKLGEGEWEWAKIGHRFEQVWAAQTKELWHFGMPLRPSLLDVLRTKTENGLSRAAAQKLPDRREGARLAERLASGLTAPNFSSASLVSDIDAAVRQLGQYTSEHGEDAHADASGAARNGSKPAFAGLEALRQMRRQKNQ